MTIEDVLKIIGIVLFPSIGAVVWLLGQMYGLRTDLRHIQTLLEADRTQSADRIRRLEATVEKIADALSHLTIDLAKHGLQELKKKEYQ